MVLTRFLVYLLLVLLVVRALRGFFAGMAQGMRGQAAPSRRPFQRPGVRMARDPVCGTFVIPGSSLAVRDADGLHHFCSDKCRDAFVARARRSS
jgi:YHS domain-containing protein